MRKWTDELERINVLRLSRHQFNNTCASEVELHVFCDASEKGFASVLYYRWRTEDGGIEVSIVVAKSRVAPTKSSLFADWSCRRPCWGREWPPN